MVSKDITHEPRIDDATFERAQAILQQRGRGTGGQHVRQRTRNPYVFRGLIYCAACNRRMQGQYNHGDVYLREDALTDPLDTWLASAFAPHRIAQTIIAMADAEPLHHPPTTGSTAQAIITECDAKLERYRAALDAGTDPAVVTGWIAQTQAERTRAEAGPTRHRGFHPAPDEPSRNRCPGDPTRRHHHRAPRRRPLRQGRGLPATRTPAQLPAGNANGARRSQSQRAPWGNGLCPRATRPIAHRQ
ncbi:zinc ribbon domain-containing protein [Micromonospora sp. WMMD729]|uniref:zinc ribbon domain-containing protein n=1 Tax=Micromonospora sp. WMMD729 TaxID=3404127 RepID=UPI003BF48B49